MHVEKLICKHGVDVREHINCLCVGGHMLMEMEHILWTIRRMICSDCSWYVASFRQWLHRHRRCIRCN